MTREHAGLVGYAALLVVALAVWLATFCSTRVEPAVSPTPTVPADITRVTVTETPGPTLGPPEHPTAPAHVTIEVIPTDEPTPGPVQRG